MSSPIAIPRVAATASGAASSMSTSPTGLYVPVHKRRDASHSPASSRCSSPALSTSPSWRIHTPSKEPTAAFRKHRKTPSNASSGHTASTTTHIPKHNMIPQPALPHTYSIHTLLALSSHPAPLSQHQHDTLRSLATAIAPRDTSDKPAPRRRRTGRKAKNASPKIAIQTADVETRRRRHAHGTWGWQPYASSDALSHQQELEESWRHAAPVAIAV